MMIAERARPDRAHLIHFENAQEIRDEIARAVPFYEGIERLSKAGEQVQWGGERLCEERLADGSTKTRFNAKGGRAHFSDLKVMVEPANGRLRLSTRRGKQFNSMVHRDHDPLTGARRDDVLISRLDADRIGITDGDEILLISGAGQMSGRCRVSPIAAGNVQVHWPEGNVLIERGVTDPECGIPDYNTLVEIRRAGG